MNGLGGVLRSASTEQLLVLNNGRGQSQELGLQCSDNIVLSWHFKPAARKLGIGWVNWQVLRRSCHATKMAEAGVPESTMLALMGRMSRAMLERYSHIRMAAKREAVEALSVKPKPAKQNGVSTVSTTVEQPERIQ